MELGQGTQPAQVVDVSLKASFILSLTACLIVIWTLTGVHDVSASGSTSFANVHFPNQVFSFGPELAIDADVYYSGAGTGYTLGVFAAEYYDVLYSANSMPFSGSVTSDLPCYNPEREYTGCMMHTVSSSGKVHVTFHVVEIPRGPKVWHIILLAGLWNAYDNLDTGSVGYFDFSIDIAERLMLNVRAPIYVAVSVDGVVQQPGNVWVDLYPGSHSISVPETVPVTPGSRLRFNRWSDGVLQPTRIMQLESNTKIEAIYVRQYQLSLESPPANATGAGWYDEDSSARFSAPVSQPLPGLIGKMGGRWTFQGWYENDTLVTASANGTLTMKEPHYLTARWTQDYSMPAIIIGAALSAGIIVVIMLLRHKWRSSTPNIQSEVPVAPMGPAPTSLQIAPAQEARQMKFCRHCGVRILRDSKFCEECGGNLA